MDVSPPGPGGRSRGSRPPGPLRSTSRAGPPDALEHWLQEEDLHPRIIGEFEDSALLKTFGQAGLGVFPAPTVVSEEVCTQYHVRPIAELESVQERFYAISVERRIKHPAVSLIFEHAKQQLFR